MYSKPKQQHPKRTKQAITNTLKHQTTNTQIQQRIHKQRNKHNTETNKTIQHVIKHDERNTKTASKNGQSNIQTTTHNAKHEQQK